MGTTKTAMTGADGLHVQWVLAIEGYQYLLTDGATAPVVTAWAGTDWSSVLGGLEVEGHWSQSIDPWKPFSETESVTFIVRDVDGADTVGIEMNRRDSGDETLLDVELGRSSPTSITVKSTAAFAASGSVNIGPENIAYTGKTATTFTTLTRGKFSLFGTEASARFSRNHQFGTAGDGLGQITDKPRVTEYPRSWVGRWVGLWAHRNVGGTLDTKAQAQLVWAGQIAEVSDRADASTAIECDHVMDIIKRTALFRDQFTGVVAEGIYVPAASYFVAEEYGTDGTVTADDLVVKASGASGNYEMNAGLYTPEELCAKIQNWISAEVGAPLLGRWVVGVKTTDNGQRVGVSVEFSTGVAIGEVHGFRIGCSDSRILHSLGFDTGQMEWDGGLTAVVVSSAGTAPTTSMTATLTAARSPARVDATQLTEGGVSRTCFLSSTSGTWFNNRPYLPGTIAAPAAENWGIVQVGDAGLFLAKYIDADELELHANPALSRMFGFGQQESLDGAVVSTDEPGEILIRQVAILEGSFATLFLYTLYSTGTANYNRTAYDSLPADMGAAIPYGLASLSSFETSLLSLEGSSTPSSTVIVIEQPTTFEELWSADLLLRRAQLVWKDQGLYCSSWSTPSSGAAVHTLTESNKATAAGVGDSQRSVTVESDKWLRNIVKVQYNRTLDGAYHDSITIRSDASADEYGDRVMTIKARNSYGGSRLGTADVIPELAAGVGSWLPFFARPIRLVRRTISFNFFEGMAPGDVATVSDNFARSTATGIRGLTGKPAVIFSHSYTWGGHGRDPVGEIDLFMQDQDRSAPYSPAAEVDDTANSGGFSAGYNSGTNTLRCYASKYSETAEADDATYFDTDEEIMIVEIDPAVPGSPTTWNRTISSQSANDIVLTSGLSSPAWDAAKRYRIVSRYYTSAAATQQGDSYQADDADALIQDTAAPYQYGAYVGGSFTPWSADDYPERYATVAYGDGAPLDPGYERSMGSFVNNFVNYKSSPCTPYVADNMTAGHAGGFQLLAIRPIFIGRGELTNARRRKLYVAPMIRTSVGAVNCRVTVTRIRPPLGLLEDPSYPAIYARHTFSTSSATFEIPTEQAIDLTPIVLPNTEFLWVSIDGENGLGCRGLATCRLGPLE